ncbi:MAG: hypothetical protein IKR11_13675 [Solobacterium sp.]|nr:hypothetical protein [Solobacterium sp.]
MKKEIILFLSLACLTGCQANEKQSISEPSSVEEEISSVIEEEEVPVEEEEIPAETIVTAEEAKELPAEYDSFMVNEEGYVSQILIHTNKDLQNFQVLQLNYEGVGEGGILQMSAKTVYTQSTLSKDKPFLLTMTFYGDMPSYGISYDDSEVQYKAISMSGYDGSIYLENFIPVEATSSKDADRYADLLSDIYHFVLQDGTVDSIPADTGIFEMTNLSDNPLNQIGYTFLDLDHDGENELLIYAIEPEGLGAGNRLLAIYTQGDQPVLEGWARNRYYLLDGEIIYNEGSSGAASSVRATYELNGLSLKTIDFYFTELKSDSMTVGCYHNTTGIWDVNASEELDITEEEFWDKMSEYELQIQYLPVTPFSQFTEN